MKIDYSGKTVLITGATRGIGSEIAHCLYDVGANLILTGTKEKEIEALNRNCIKNNMAGIKFFQCDFSSDQSTDKFLSEIDKFKSIDVCINNAGINIINDFVDTKFDDFVRMNQINLFGPYRLLQTVGKKMIDNNYGRVVNIASIWSVITRPGRSMYTATKNAIVGLTKTLSVEWAPYNVLVNAVSPGFTLTELTMQTNTQEQLSELENIIPARRMCQPIEQARVVAFLCSDLNTYLTGQNIVIDGGYINV